MNNNNYSICSEFYFKALIKNQSYDIDEQGETIKRQANCTRLQICNLPPLILPATVGNFVYVRIVNIEGMKKFFGTLERNRLLLDDLWKMLDDLKSTTAVSLFDPAPGEIVLVKINERFLRGCIVRKRNFMTCTTYLIDCGITMEIGLEHFYVINKELLEIPPQAFLMLLESDIDQPFISNDELNRLVKDTVVAFRLRNVSENGEAFVGTMIIQNDAGEICDLGNILQEGFHTTDNSVEDDNESDKPLAEEIMEVKNDYLEDECVRFGEDDRSVISLHSSDSQSDTTRKFHKRRRAKEVSADIKRIAPEMKRKGKKNDGCIGNRRISVGDHLQGKHLLTEDSEPGLFYLYFLDGPTGFEEMRSHSTSLFGKYDNIWHKLQVIPSLEHSIKDGIEFVCVGSAAGWDAALYYGGEQLDAEQRNHFKLAFACRLAYSAPKPFNNNIYSCEAKSYFNTKLSAQLNFDVHIVAISRRNILEVEIYFPEGGNFFEKLCELNFAQRRWAWKPPLYHFDLINEEQFLQRTDDEDDVHITFTVQMENKRNDLIEFQKHLKRGEHLLQNPKVSDICIVECEGQLFRGEIVDITDKEDYFVVRYVDYGDEQEVNANSLHSVDGQKEIVMEVPVFGIKCRLEGIQPAGDGLDVETGSWSRKALNLINSVIPLNKQFLAFIGPPKSDGVHPIRVVVARKLFYGDDLDSTLVLNNLAVHRHYENYSSIGDLSLLGNLEIKYLNVEDGVVYGIPSIHEIWLSNCRCYLEKASVDNVEENKTIKTGFILYENKYYRVIKLQSKIKQFWKPKERFFLVDEGKTIELSTNSEVPSIISFSALKEWYICS